MLFHSLLVEEFHAKQTRVNEKKFFAKKAPNHQHEHIKLLWSIFIFLGWRTIPPLFSPWKLNSESEIEIETDARGCGISADYIIIAAAKSQWIRNDVSLSLLPRHESEVWIKKCAYAHKKLLACGGVHTQKVQQPLRSLLPFMSIWGVWWPVRTLFSLALATHQPFNCVCQCQKPLCEFKNRARCTSTPAMWSEPFSIIQLTFFFIPLKGRTYLEGVWLATMIRYDEDESAVESE